MSEQSEERHVPPPPGDESLNEAEALYHEGMANYQRRRWKEALEAFTRLQELQPDRPGLNTLLDEVQWFLKLEEMEPEGGQELPPSEEEVIEDGQSRRFWWVLILLLVLGSVVVFFFLHRAGQAEAQKRYLYNRGQARLAAGDYEGAREAFQELLTIDPSNQGAEAGLEQATKLQNLAMWYAQAHKAIKEEKWDAAIENLRKILAEDPNYEDARQLLDMVTRQQRLAELYNDGTRFRDKGSWEECIQRLSQVQEIDPEYRKEAVREHLFFCYLKAGESLIDDEQPSVATANKAIQRFNSALLIHPKNQEALQKRNMAQLYMEGLKFLEQKKEAEALTRFQIIYSYRQDYAKGQLAQILYGLYLDVAKKKVDDGDYLAALSYLKAALALDVKDKTKAQSLFDAVVQALATPIPTSTATVTPTPTPLPTATPTPTPMESPTPTQAPTQAPLPPTPTPKPKPKPSPTPTPRPQPTPTPLR